MEQVCPIERVRVAVLGNKHDAHARVVLYSSACPQCKGAGEEPCCELVRPLAFRWVGEADVSGKSDGRSAPGGAAALSDHSADQERDQHTSSVMRSCRERLVFEKRERRRAGRPFLF